MLKLKQLEPNDLALAIILQDPILFPEFMRSTQDGDMEHKNAWSRFKYRWYQKDILTDKNSYISITGGRSIGKCMLTSDRVYTEFGYATHQELHNKPVKVWSINANGELELRRAKCVENGLKKVWYLETANDNQLSATELHPIFTQDGFKFAKDINVGDLVATITKLPHVQSSDNTWQDVRLLGYLIYKIHGLKKEGPLLKTKSKRIKEEFRLIAEYYDARFEDTEEGIVLKRKSKFKEHPITTWEYFFGLQYVRLMSTWESRHNRFTKQIMQLNERDLKLFLEAFCSQYAELSYRKIRIPIPNYRIERQIRELFLRFGIMMRSIDGSDTRKEITRDTKKIQRYNYYVETLEDYDAFKFWKTFTIPGYTIENIPEIEDRPLWVYVPITKKERHKFRVTYALQVERNHTYIAEDIYVHNSLILEDKILFDMWNSESQLGRTPELVLTTANQAQMTPLLDHLNGRILRSPLLKSFTRTGVNKQAGTLDVSIGGRAVRMYTRIAGNKGANNMVGLHTPRIIIDESQLFPLVSFTELMPVLNKYEPEHQIIIAGVPNSLTNTVLYRIDKKNTRYKRYRIPAPNNPWFFHKDYMDALKDYQGEDDDRFQTLILGRHGTGSEQVLTRDQIATEDYPFYSYVYNFQDKNKGLSYEDKLVRHEFKCDMYMVGIDTGFVDPTIISIFGLRNGKWYHLCRYKLQRIQYPEQELIIHWLNQYYRFTRIGIDIGAGGGGATILQSLIMRKEYAAFKYENVLNGIQFAQSIVIGYDEHRKEIIEDTKTVGARELIKHVQSQTMVFNSLDNEGLSQIERIAKQKALNGKDRYYVVSERGAGADKNDHIFSSLICFCMLIRDMSFLNTKKKRLGKMST